MAECGSTHAEITWVPGNENNDEVIAFYVYYNTSFDEKDQFHQGAEVLRGTEKAKVGNIGMGYSVYKNHIILFISYFRPVFSVVRFQVLIIINSVWCIVIRELSNESFL